MKTRTMKMMKMTTRKKSRKLENGIVVHGSFPGRIGIYTKRCKRNVTSLAAQCRSTQRLA